MERQTDSPDSLQAPIAFAAATEEVLNALTGDILDRADEPELQNPDSVHEDFTSAAAALLEGENTPFSPEEFMDGVRKYWRSVDPSRARSSEFAVIRLIGAIRKQDPESAELVEQQAMSEHGLLSSSSEGEKPVSFDYRAAYIAHFGNNGILLQRD